MDYTNSAPLLGDKCPQLQVWTTQGARTIPDDYAGKWLVLFSHPGDFTPVCTTEFMSFARKAVRFYQLNCELLGLSIDQVTAHLKWIEWINQNTEVMISFPVIEDGLGRVASRLGMIHPNKGSSTVRAVFILDPEGIIRLIMYYPQEIGRNVNEILRALKALQVADANKVAMPENWPHNSFLGDRVIIPPARSEQQIKARQEGEIKGEFKCKDWWFCYKKL